MDDGDIDPSSLRTKDELLENRNPIPPPYDPAYFATMAQLQRDDRSDVMDLSQEDASMDCWGALDPDDLDFLADTRQWTKLAVPSASHKNNTNSHKSFLSMVSYRKGDKRLDFQLDTGVVELHELYSNQKETLRCFRQENISSTDATELFDHPTQDACLVIRKRHWQTRQTSSTTTATTATTDGTLYPTTSHNVGHTPYTTNTTSNKKYPVGNPPPQRPSPSPVGPTLSHDTTNPQLPTPPRWVPPTTTALVATNLPQQQHQQQQPYNQLDPLPTPPRWKRSPSDSKNTNSRLGGAGRGGTNRRQNANGRRQPCRFGAKCKRANCWFDHNGDDDAATVVAGSRQQQPRRHGVCRYGANCKRKVCNFQHPPAHQQS